MFTVAPFPAAKGENDVILGYGMKVKSSTESQLPFGVVTVILPDVVSGTTAVIVASSTTRKLFAATPEKLTAVAPVKPVPLIVTVLQIAADAGVNDEIVGGAGLAMHCAHVRNRAQSIKRQTVLLTIAVLPSHDSIHREFRHGHAIARTSRKRCWIVLSERLLVKVSEGRFEPYRSIL